MIHHSLWKYCTSAHCREYLISSRLLPADWPAEKQLACLYALANHPEAHYTAARIPKKSGGTRQILQPDPLLKAVQRNILHHVLDGFRASPYATAYRKGASILKNARPHAGAPVLLRLDIADFFTSITFPMVYSRAFVRTALPPAIAGLLAALCCYKGYLPQGAPTSAAISNLVMRPFDYSIAAWCRPLGITYTRYCDDMSFSGAFDPRVVERKVDSLLGCMGFGLNRKKTCAATQGARQLVTGVVVNTHPQATREYRRGLRQELYHCQTHGVASHLTHTRGAPPTAQEVHAYLQSLCGRIGFVLQLNPEDSYFRGAKELATGWVKAAALEKAPRM